LHKNKSQHKQTKEFNEGIIQWRRCISCNKYVTFFSRGVGCIIHSWHLNKKNIQVPCIGQYTCEALRSCPNLCKRSFENIKRPQCICCLCYEKLGGHIHHRSGSRGIKATTCITEELHADDITKGLEFIGNLLIRIAQTKSNEIKENILIKTLEILLTSIESSDYEKCKKIILNEAPSLFMIKILFIKIFREKEVNKKVEINDLPFKVNIFIFLMKK